jgi:hypothetical protein
MGSIKIVVGVALIVGVVYLCAMLIPPYFSNYQFEDAIETEARMSTYSSKTEDAIRDTIYKKAQELDIPIGKDKIAVRRSGTMGSGYVSIEGDYLVHVDLPGYPMDLHFHPSTKNKGTY